MKIESVAAGTYIVAVSGGVDSVVLLDVLSKKEGARLIVAHVDHGIRADSAADARFVAALAANYGLAFESCTLQLGEDASEDQARRERYAWLHKMAEQHGAAATITAHHIDDVVETIVHNLLRGTGWRGLCSLRPVSGGETRMLRPLLANDKQIIISYAVSQRLEWCEDATNHTDDYMRNRLRHHVIPLCMRLDSAFKARLIALWREQSELRDDIEDSVAAICKLLSTEATLMKAPLATLEAVLAEEVLRQFLLHQGVRQTRPQLARALSFLRNAHSGKQFSLNRAQFLTVRGTYLVVENREN